MGFSMTMAADVHRKTKTRSKSRGLPVFLCLVEILGHDTLRLHPNVAASIDAALAGKQPVTQLGTHTDRRFIVHFETPQPAKGSKGGPAAPLRLTKLAEQDKARQDKGILRGM